MQADKQQQIIGYFIEEANEHLNTLEDGLLNLPTAIEDPESVNEMFRAAHSVKGGAAMLGFSSIQKTAHHLEDCLKILKEQPVPVDERLVSLFLSSFDTLKKLTEELQSPFGLQAEKADEIVKASESTFSTLESYLSQLIGEAPGEPAYTLPTDFSPRVMTLLKQMLLLFKQPDSAANRQKLQGFCGQLGQLVASEPSWQAVVQAATKAIAVSTNTYAALAPILIKELKQASELLQAGRTAELTVSQALQKLANSPTAAAPVAKATPSPTPVSAPTSISTTLQVPLEPKAAAQLLIKSFNRQQLTELTKLLIVAVKQQA